MNAIQSWVEKICFKKQSKNQRDSLGNLPLELIYMILEYAGNLSVSCLNKQYKTLQNTVTVDLWISTERELSKNFTLSSYLELASKKSPREKFKNLYLTILDDLKSMKIARDFGSSIFSPHFYLKATERIGTIEYFKNFGENREFFMRVNQVLNPAQEELVFSTNRSVLNVEFQYCIRESASLTRISLFNSRLQIIPPDLFQNCLFLRHITLKTPSLKKVPGNLFERLGRLETVELNVPEIRPSLFRQTSLLRSVKINGDNLKVIPEDLFSNCPSLECVTISGDSIQKIPSSLFKQNSHLESVYISGKKISELPRHLFEHNPQLYFVTIHDTSIQKIPAHIFRNMPFLREIDLTRNKIVHLPPRLLSNCPRLDSVYLANNQIKKIPADLIEDCPQLEIVSLVGNPLPLPVIHRYASFNRKGEPLDSFYWVYSP